MPVGLQSVCCVFWAASRNQFGCLLSTTNKTGESNKKKNSQNYQIAKEWIFHKDDARSHPSLVTHGKLLVLGQ